MYPGVGRQLADGRALLDQPVAGVKQPGWRNKRSLRGRPRHHLPHAILDVCTAVSPKHRGEHALDKPLRTRVPAADFFRVQRFELLAGDVERNDECSA